MAGLAIILWFAFSLAIAALNQYRGNKFFVALLISILLSPVVGLIVVLATRPRKKQIEKRKKAHSKL